jgi:hypothetical protein
MAVGSGVTHAQSTPAAPVVVLADVGFYGARANSIEPGDSTMAQTASERMRRVLRASHALSLVDSARVASVLANADRPGVRCSGNVECVRSAGQAVAARWVVMATVSKLSNLIWYLSGQVIDVSTGRIVLDDAFELKGPRDEMVPRGAESLARRVERAVVREVEATAGRQPPRS